jgi:ABC-type amino acid transport substrate-binding protein
MKIPRLLAPGLSCALACGLLSIATAAPSLPEAFQRIEKNKRIVVALHAEDSPPFFYTDKTGALQGIDVDLAKLIAAKLGVKLVIKRTAKDFDGVIDEISAGSADIGIAALYPSLDRMKSVIFTEPYMEIPAIIVVNRAQAARSGIQPADLQTLDRPGTTVGYIDSPIFSDAVHNFFHHVRIKLYPDRAALLGGLRSGEVAAAFIDEIEATKWRGLIPDFDLYFSSIRLQNSSFTACMAVNWKDEHLAYWLNELIRQSRADGALDAVVRRHFTRF